MALLEARGLCGEIRCGWQCVDPSSGALRDVCCLGKGHLVALRVRAEVIRNNQKVVAG